MLTWFAANHPDAIGKFVMLEVPHPFDAFMQNSALPQLAGYDLTNPNHRTHPWWFAFNHVAGLPERLLARRKDILLDRMYDHLNRTPGAIRAGNGWYQTVG